MSGLLRSKLWWRPCCGTAERPCHNDRVALADRANFIQERRPLAVEGAGVCSQSISFRNQSVALPPEPFEFGIERVDSTVVFGHGLRRSRRRKDGAGRTV